MVIPATSSGTAALRIHVDGATALAATRRGNRDEVGILFAHGLGQTGGAWDAAARALADAGHGSLAYDARGHGGSSWNPPGIAYQPAQFTDDLIIIAGEMSTPPVLVAASMGGLFGLLAEARWPGLFRALVLVDITPRWDAAGVARIIDFMRAHPHGFASLDAAADAIARYQPHRPRKSADALRQVLRPGDDGLWRWHWDPRLIDDIAAGDANMQQQALAEATRQVRCPILLLSGGRSDLVTPQTIAEFLALAPHAEHVQLADATHMLAGDDNTAFTAAVLHYLDALPHPTATSNTTEYVTGARP